MEELPIAHHKYMCFSTKSGYYKGKPLKVSENHLQSALMTSNGLQIISRALLITSKGANSRAYVTKKTSSKPL